MKHTRRRTLKRNFLAKLCRAKLNYNPGKIEFSRFEWTSKSAKHKDGISHPHFHGFNQRFADEYGLIIESFIDPWLGHRDGMNDRRYVEHVSDHPHAEFCLKDFTKQFRRREKHRRKLKRMIKRYGLEHKLLYK